VTSSLVRPLLVSADVPDDIGHAEPFHDIEPLERLLNTFIAYANPEEDGLVLKQCCSREYLETIAGIRGKFVFYYAYLSPPAATLVVPIITRESVSPMGRRYRYRVDGRLLADHDRRLRATAFVSARLRTLQEQSDQRKQGERPSGQTNRSAPGAASANAQSFRAYHANRRERYVSIIKEVADILGLAKTLSLRRIDWLDYEQGSTVPKRLWLDVEAAWCDRRMQVLRAGFPDPQTQFFGADGSALDAGTFALVVKGTTATAQ
jgi:hypothetical protein